MHLHRFAGPTVATLATGALLLTLTGCTSGPPDAAPSKPPHRTAVAESLPSATVTPSPSVSTPASEGSPEPSATTGPAPAQTPSAPEPLPVSGTYPATPLITFASWDASSTQVQAGGLVTGQLDSSGVCRLTLVKGTASVSRDSTPQASASSVACGTFSIPGSQLSSGAWSATLSYVVGSRKVASAAQTVVVP